MPNLRVSFPTPCEEKWESMKKLGHHRVCGKCDKVIHDLSQYSASQIEEMLQAEPDSCVRAVISSSGTVDSKPEIGSNILRVVAAVGASASLLISHPALAKDKPVSGAIAGQIYTFGFKTRVIAKDATGHTFRSTVRSNGRFKIKNLPAGTYSLEFNPDCGEGWTRENIVVGGGDTIVSDQPNDGGCIIVGRLELERNLG